MSNNELVVTKHNSLIEASYKLTLNEQRLISFCIGKIDPRKPLPKDNMFEITAKEFAKEYGISPKKAYKELEEASKNLFEQDIKTYDGKYRERFRWIYGARYHDGEGKVTLGFSPWVIPYLTMLNQRFTSYYLQQIAELKSIYSIRLFEFLMQFKSTGRFIIELSRFRERLGLTTQYERFFDLKRIVIDRSVNELNKKSNLVINWRAIKGTSGKGIKQLEFNFRETHTIEQKEA